MALDVFTQKLGEEKMPRLDADNTGLVAVQMLDAVQTVVDVLTDNDGGSGWKVGFDPTVNAYTDRSARRQIVVSVKPLLDAKPGDSLADVAAIMTGFAVHEVGHTKLDFFTAVNKRWPGKSLPKVITNIIEDVVLELRTVERFPGFADHGEGNVFRPTLEWVAKLTCPTYPLKWEGTTGHKVNVVGQILRYKEFVTFSDDARTAEAVEWVERWAQGITPALGPSGAVQLVSDLLDYMKASMADEAVPEPTPDLPDLPSGNDNISQTIPDEDDDDTEGDDGDGDSDDEGDEGDDGGSATDAPNIDGDDGEGDGEAESGEDEGGSESDAEGDDDEDGDGEGTDEGGEADGPGKGDGNDADTMNREALEKGAQDGSGKGGSGQGVAEASDDEGDPDEGFDEADLDDTFDEVSNPDGNGYQQRQIASAEADERVTTRMDAGAHGKMRVIFR